MAGALDKSTLGSGAKANVFYALLKDWGKVNKKLIKNEHSLFFVLCLFIGSFMSCYVSLIQNNIKLFNESWIFNWNW
jgi:hypothetical protein